MNNSSSRLSLLLVIIVMVLAVYVFSKQYQESHINDFSSDTEGVKYMLHENSENLTAPQIPSGFTWINSEPLTLEELRGNVVILDFWTYCCINCMHVIPDLKYLEAKYKDKPFVVIGVHAAKFDNEESDENI